MTPEEFVQMIVSETPIWPYDEHNACHFCGVGWAEEIFAEWLERDVPGRYVSRHHDSDCVWVLAHQVKVSV